MKRYGCLQGLASLLACMGLLIPQTSQAASPTDWSPASTPAVLVERAEPAVTDVALAAGGTFRGQVVDQQGLPLAGAKVSLRQLQTEVAATTTDADGNFSVSELPGGVYLVMAGPTSGLYRLWSPGTAPPGANDSAMLVAGGNLMRGQGGWMYWATNPWVIGGVIAAAITIPIAVTNHNRHSGS